MQRLLAQDNEDQAGAPAGVVAARLADGLDALGGLGVRRRGRRVVAGGDGLGALKAEAPAQRADGARGEGRRRRRAPWWARPTGRAAKGPGGPERVWRGASQ